MNFFSRKLGSADMAADTATDQDAQRIVHREIEVKVERTWTTLSARAPSTGGAPTPASGAEPPLAPPAPLQLDERTK